MFDLEPLISGEAWEQVDKYLRHLVRARDFAHETVIVKAGENGRKEATPDVLEWQIDWIGNDNQRITDATRRELRLCEHGDSVELDKDGSVHWVPPQETIWQRQAPAHQGERH